MKNVRLGDAVKLLNGYAFKSENYSNSGIPLLRISNFDNGNVFIDDKTIYVNESYLVSKKEFIVEKGDILIALSGATTGKYGIYNFDFPSILNQRIGLIKSGKSKILFGKYFFHYLTILRNKILVKAGGAAQPNISTKTIGELEIPLPPLETQKKIAAILDAADAYRQKTKALIAKYNELTQSLFLDMFGDPACNPKNFKLRKLEDFYINKKDGTKCGPFGGALKKNEFRESGIAVWNMDNISKNGELNKEINLWISDEKYKELQSYSVINDDIIISRAGTVGKMCVVKTDHEKSIISTNLIRLRLDKNKLLPDFFTLLMTYFKERLGRLKTGSEGGFTHMNTGILNDLIFPYPPIELQNQFAERVQQIEVQKAQAQQSLEKSEELFHSLLQRAFSGESF